MGRLSLTIWTTTPWTLPANQAVALNPDLDYVVVQTEGQAGDGLGRERLVVAEGLLRGHHGPLRRGAVPRPGLCARGPPSRGCKLRPPLL